MMTSLGSLRAGSDVGGQRDCRRSAAIDERECNPTLPVVYYG